MPLNWRSSRTTCVKREAWDLAESARGTRSAMATRGLLVSPRPVPARNQQVTALMECAEEPNQRGRVELRKGPGELRHCGNLVVAGGCQSASTITLVRRLVIGLCRERTESRAFPNWLSTPHRARRSSVVAAMSMLKWRGRLTCSSGRFVDRITTPYSRAAASIDT